MPNFPNWSTLLEALEQLLPTSAEAPGRPFPSETLLKLYTVVFDYCVGTGVNNSSQDKTISAFMYGEELYKAVGAFITARFNLWASHPLSLSDVLKQMNCVAAAEKPLIFIFTYLERHWIDRQINDQRADVLPMKQLLWHKYDSLVLAGHLDALLPAVRGQLEGSWRGEGELEDLRQVAMFAHYLRVISTPGLVESDFAATKRHPAPGLLINALAGGSSRFSDFVLWYRAGLTSFLQSFFSSVIDSDWIQRALLFWNHEEGRMVYLRFDKPAQVSIRTCLKETLLLPHLPALTGAFGAAIQGWNVLEANAIYRLLANRKSLLVQLDGAAQEALTRKGLSFLSEVDTSASPAQVGQQFVTLLGQFYNLSTELIQTALASRPEIFEARGRAFRVLLNGGKRAKFAARSLALVADYVVASFPDLIPESEQMLTILMALFRLLDEKDEFGEAYGNLLARRLLLEGVDALKGSSEAELLARLSATCGAAFTAHFERMRADVQAAQELTSQGSVTLLTGGTWTVKGKRLLPGHSILNAAVDWPQDSSPIAAFEASYAATAGNRSRRLNWIPMLSEVFVDLVLDDSSLSLRASCAQLSLLEQLFEGSVPVASSSEYTHLLTGPMIRAGLLKDAHTIDPNWTELTGPIDVFSPLISDLLATQTSTTGPTAGVRSFSTTGTASTSRKSTVPGTSTSQPLSRADKLTLLQCQISRLLKQLRCISLADLYNRLSMLPVLLSRFSPEVEEVDAAVCALAEKEFVQLVAGEEAVLAGEEAIKEALQAPGSSDYILVRYLA